MVNKVTEGCINEIQDRLRDYIMEHSSKNKNRKFTCFNKHAHKHMDEDPSAAIVPGTNGRHWTCFSCGAKGDILQAAYYKEGIQGFSNQVRYLSGKYNIKIQKESLDTTTKHNHSLCKQNKSSVNSNDSKSNCNPIDEGKNFHLQASTRSNALNYTKKTAANYYYEDEKGTTLYKIRRREWMEEGKRKKDFMAYAREKNSWGFGIKNTRHVIYKLPQVLKSISVDEIIFFVEGEKCVEQIFQLGLVGTTTAFGARGFSSYSKDYASSLKGASVVILPDNDDSGRAYATDVVNALKYKAKSIKVLELPGLELKGDIVDWIEDGGTKEELITLVNNTDEVALEESTIQERGIGNIFEDEFCYYKYHKEQRINISNFIISPKYYIENEVDTQIIGDIVTEGGVIEDKVFKTTDFDDVISFRKALSSFKTLYVGRVEDLQYIRFLISSKGCYVKKGVTYSGFHKHNNQWCFVSEEGALDFQGNVMEDIILQNQYAELNTNILKQEAITREELLLIAP